MFDSSRYDPLAIAIATVRKHVRDADPAVVEPARAEELVGVFAELERLAAAGKALYAKRVADSGRWQSSGERSAADWLAKKTGTSTGAARGALDTAKHVADAPGVDEAFRSGALSAPQAEAIAAAAAVADPGAEEALLAAAKTKPLQKLRDECARVKAAAVADPAARHERIHRSRFWRRWTDAEGARCGMYKMTPEAAAILEANAQPFIDAAFDTARRAGEHEPSEAYAADGLVAMSQAANRTDHHDDDTPDAGPGAPALPGDGPGGPDRPRPPTRGPRARRRGRELIGIVNLESLRRGSVERGEVCEIAGVGPVPLEVLRELFSDALLRVVIRDGVDIRTVVHAGRSPSDVQQTAVRVRDDGRCVRPSCGRFIAEIDHVDDYHDTRHTTLTELGGLCKHDHNLKTSKGHRYWHGERGWEWHCPDGTIEYERPPP